MKELQINHPNTTQTFYRRKVPCSYSKTPNNVCQKRVNEEAHQVLRPFFMLMRKEGRMGIEQRDEKIQVYYYVRLI